VGQGRIGGDSEDRAGRMTGGDGFCAMAQMRQLGVDLKNVAAGGRDWVGPRPFGGGWRRRLDR
jgi:hypothetical protein